MKKNVKEIEKQLEELYPKKEVAYQDYRDNSGDSSIRDRLWSEFVEYRDEWNELVEQRKKLLKT